MTSDVLQTFPIRKKWPPPPAALAVQPVLVARSIRIRENPHQKGYVDNSEDSQNEQRSPYRQLRRGECSEKDQNREEDTMDYRRKTWTTAEVKTMLDKAGYAGERIVLLHPTDQVVYHAFISVVADRFRKVGLNIDEQMTDWGTIVQRRTSKEPVDVLMVPLSPTCPPCSA